MYVAAYDHIKQKQCYLTGSPFPKINCMTYLLFSASPEFVVPVLDEHMLYYTEDLNISCECKGIPVPDVNWVTSSPAFSKQNAIPLPNSGECSGIYHSDQYLIWSMDANEESRKNANGLELKCECSHSGENVVDRVTLLDVQCKCMDSYSIR